MSAQPKSLLIVRPDTFGDLVLFEPFVRLYTANRPQDTITLLVRAGYEEISPLFPTKIRWLTTEINPFKDDPENCRSSLEKLLGELAETAPDVVLAPSLKRTWLEVAIAAHFPNASRIALGAESVEPVFQKALELTYGIDGSNVFSERVGVDAGMTDADANLKLVRQIVGRPIEGSAPQLQVPLDAQTRVTQLLSQMGLAERKWVAVFPAGIANVHIKAWLPENFGAVASWIEKELGLSVLLLGHESEAAVIEEVKTTAGGSLRSWLGKGGDLDVLAAFLQKAALYVGNDTGAMHIAGAVGTGVVGLFGGGHWPRFRPAAERAIAVVQPLPCFGCDWDCIFGDAPCVKTIGVQDVQAAIQRLLESPSVALNEVHVAGGLPVAMHPLIARATPVFRQLQKDRFERQHKIEELKSETSSKDDEIGALKRTADERKAEMEEIKSELEAECATKDREILELKTETNGKDDEIVGLKRATDSLKEEIYAIKAELEGECATKDVEIAALKGEADGKDAEIAALKKVCDEREELIITQAGHIEHFQKAVAGLGGAVQAKDAELAALKTRLDELQSSLGKAQEEAGEINRKLSVLPADAMAYAEFVAAKDVHIRNIEALVNLRDQEIARLHGLINEREVTVQHYQVGMVQLEQAKHYSKLLGEKESVIQTLHNACVEREKVIKKLALESTGLTGGIAKLAYATQAHVQLAWWQPFNTWLFKKVVEDYWMQIGILRHYDPKPIRWDRMPRLRVDAKRLPQIGIVTPSYGQAQFVESTMLSVINQKYEKLRYVVQDGGSKDASPAIIERYAPHLHHWVSERDAGQADAVCKGFRHLAGALQPDDVMAWLNSDDLLSPGSLRYVAEYFAKNPDVDVIYGHRIIIDSEDREVGRWMMPRHDPKVLEWIDYVPQETLFWRKRAWDLAGGVDPSFQFALDWDLLARFTQAGCKMVRVPYFLGCFRVHSEQKTSHAIHTVGAEEMRRIRTRFHGEKQNDFEMINAYARRVRFRGALVARLAALGVRY